MSIISLTLLVLKKQRFTAVQLHIRRYGSFSAALPAHGSAATAITTRQCVCVCVYATAYYSASENSSALSLSCDPSHPSPPTFHVLGGHAQQTLSVVDF